MNPFISLEPDKFYHIYNRGNNRECIFFAERNYQYFMDKYAKYMSDYIDTYAWCLLSNHFHFLVRIKSEEEIKNAANRDIPNLKDSEYLVEDLVSERFRRFFLGYSKAINKRENRTGSLFQKNFQRKFVDSETYAKQLVSYIHNNPVHHGFTDDCSKYKWSSYKSFLSSKPTKVKRDIVLDWFDRKENFIHIHQSMRDFSLIERMIIEDE